MYRSEAIRNKDAALFQKAFMAYESTLNLVENDLPRWAKNIFQLGWMYRRQGLIFLDSAILYKSIVLYDLAIEIFKKAKKDVSDYYYLRTLVDKGAVCCILYEMTNSADEKLLSKGIRCFDEIIKSADNIKYEKFVIDTFCNRGQAHYLLGRHKKKKSHIKRAKEDCHHALSICEKSQYQEGIERMGKLIRDIESIDF